MSESALEFRDVHKRYGSLRALDGLSFAIPARSITGFIGPNGAGKTTSFGIAAGQLTGDSGEVSVFGNGPYSPGRHRGRLTVLPQDSDFPLHMPVRGLLIAYARLQGLSAAAAARSADAAIEMVSLAERAHAPIKTLSHGMRRRVAVAQAFLGEPELVLLDEPTSGLDPEHVASLRDAFASQRGKRTIVISSHILKELEEVCDHVVFIERGHCRRAGSMAEVTRRGGLVRVRLAGSVPLEPLAVKLPDLRFSWFTEEVLSVEAPEGWTPARTNALLLPALIESGAGVLEVLVGETLEAVYLSRPDGGPVERS
ncbi:MAG: ABC transporter ATP-binding protein [Planctomycetota bacterium]